MTKRTCKAPGCAKSARGLHYCTMHLARLDRTGQLEPVSPKRLPVHERFEYYVDRTDTCWIWTGNIDDNGYGRLAMNRKYTLVHRYSYEYHVGPIPEGLVIDHLCRVRACCNPDHLEPVTRGENVLRGNGWAGQNHRRTHCVEGHELTPHPTNKNRRWCQTCVRRSRRSYQSGYAAGYEAALNALADKGSA